MISNTFQTILKEHLLFHQFLTVVNCFWDAVKEDQQGVRKGIYNLAGAFLDYGCFFFIFHINSLKLLLTE